jgi:2-amino-4-hydroxy-6-hydroxymethyldihydropteridine diphosphokinase
MAIAYIAFGSNLGDREHIIQSALQKIDAHPALRILRRSALYETEPVGLPQGAGAFLNGIAEVQAECGPKDLLDYMLNLELEFGRTRSSRGGYQSRTIDLDLLFYDDVFMNDPELTLPHPEIQNREFVLLPLNELCPDKIIPATGQTVQTALRKLQKP